jgi:hypothetical protein
MTIIFDGVVTNRLPGSSNLLDPPCTDVRWIDLVGNPRLERPACIEVAIYFFVINILEKCLSRFEWLRRAPYAVIFRFNKDLPVFM